MIKDLNNTALLIIAIFLLFGVSFSQEMTVEQCIELGISNSRTLHSSSMNIMAAKAMLKDTEAARLPSLNLTGYYARLSEVDPFIVDLPFEPPMPTEFTIAPSIFDNYNLTLSLQQPIFTGFGLKSMVNKADAQAKAAEYDYNRAEDELVYNIKAAYWNLSQANQYRSLIAESIRLMEAHLKDIENFYQQGLVTKDEILKVKVQLSKIQLILVEAESGVKIAQLNLNNTIGLPYDAEVELASEVDASSMGDYDLQDLIDKAFTSRSELKALDFRIEALQAGVAGAGAALYPQVFLTGNYYYSRPNQRIQPTKEEFQGTWDIAVGISYELWNWGRTFQQKEQARAELFKAQDNREILKDAVVMEVTMGYLQWEQACNRIETAQLGVEYAEENYRVTLQRFKNDIATNTDLLEAEIDLLTAKLELSSALVDLELSRALIEKSVGL